MTVERPDIESVLGSARPKRRVGRLIGWGVVVVAVVGGAWFFLGGSGTGITVTYTTEPVAIDNLIVTVTATGTVEPLNEVVLSSELSGTIGEVNADFNDEVVQGQVLAKLKTDQLEANVELAEATLAMRQAEVRQAEITADERVALFKRTRELLEKNFTSTETYEVAKAASERGASAVAAAKANLDMAIANLRIAKSNLDKACICSPVDGVVLSRDVEVGQTVASSLSAPVLFTLAEDLAEMQLQVDIDEADVGQIAVGNRAAFSVEAFTDRQFPATITQVRLSPETVEGVVTYKAILSVDNTEMLLRPGMTATAEITVESVSDALLVPNAALRFAPPAQAEEDSARGSGLLGLLMPRRPSNSQASAIGADADGRHTVWVLEANEPVALSVETGSTDGDRTVIVGGDLSAGDPVIVASRTES